MIATTMNLNNNDANQNAMGGLFGNGKLGNQIYVLDREGFNVFTFDTTNGQTIKANVRYISSDNIYSFNRTNNS